MHHKKDRNHRARLRWLPLAVEFAKKRAVIGSEISTSRIKEFKESHDPTLEVEDKGLRTVLVKEHYNIEKGLYLTGLPLFRIAKEWVNLKPTTGKRFYKLMKKTAFVFDGRNIIEHIISVDFGFIVKGIGKIIKVIKSDINIVQYV